ncbi:hypothetical protein CBS101457_006699 [Exobasidium rhododendri]|nr:hypothetical protein CBS101457_006699 [Exobasidium rhododendri]
MCCILYCLSHPDFGLVLISNRDEYLKRPTASSQWHDFPPPTLLSTDGTPSASIAYHTQQSASASNDTLCGLDAHPLGGGTWLGITKSGRVAAITNFTESAPPPLPQGRGIEAYRSRGTLVKDWLKNKDRTKGEEEDVQDYLGEVASHMDEWPGFNLLVGQIEVHSHSAHTFARIGYVSNRSGKKDIVYLTANDTDQAGGLSNSCLDQPWDKVKQGRSSVDEALVKYDERRQRGQERQSAEGDLSAELFKILE